MCHESAGEFFQRGLPPAAPFEQRPHPEGALATQDGQQPLDPERRSASDAMSTSKDKYNPVHAQMQMPLPMLV